MSHSTSSCRNDRELPNWSASSLTAVLYLIFAQFSQRLTYENSYATTIWAPSGIALALMLVLGRRVWSGVFAGAYFANVLAFLPGQSGSPFKLVVLSGAIALGSTLEALIGEWLFRKLIGPLNTVRNSRTVLQLSGIAVVVSLASACVATCSLWASGVISREICSNIGLTWWSGDLVGILVLTPLILISLQTRGVENGLPPLKDSIVMIALLIAVAAIPFGGWLPRHWESQYVYLLSPVFLLLIIWLGQRIAAIGVVAVAWISIRQTAHGVGAFSQFSQIESQLLVQGFVCTMAITVHALAAEMAERLEISMSLMISSQDLARRLNDIRQVAETLPQMVWSCLPDGRCDYLGPQWIEYTGIPEQEQLGYGWALQLHPDDREFATRQWNDTAAHGGNLDIEFRIRRYDGVYRWFKTRAVPLKSKSGTIVKWYGTNTDIDDLRQIEQQLRGSLREIQSLKTALDEHALVAITDVQGRITYVNDKFCDTSRYSREELIGKDHRIINSGHHPRSFFQDLWSTITSGKVWRGQLRNRAKDGSHYWVDTTIVPFLDETGHPAQYVAIRSDITDRMRLMDELVHLNVELEDRVRSRTAELQNAMDSLHQEVAEHNELQRVVLEFTDNEQRRIGQDLHDGIGQELTGLGLLAGKLHSSLSRKQLAEHKLAHEIVEGLDQALIQVRSIAKCLVPFNVTAEGLKFALMDLAERIHSHTEIACQFSGDVLIDDNQVASQLYRIAQEAVANALRHSQARKIQLHLKKESNELSLRIIDNGIGFSPAVTPGTGVGLSTMQYRANLLGGSLTIESETNGGTSVVCRVKER